MAEGESIRGLPTLNEPVVDQANLLNASQKQDISQRILALHKEGKAQIGVVIVPTTGQEDIFDFAMRIAEKWQLGSTKQDNGLLMAIAVNDRRIQILTGYGLEGVIDEVESSGTNIDVSTNKSVVGPSRYPQSTWSSYAAYLNYQGKAGEKFVLQGGLRYSNFALDADFSNNLAFYPLPFSTAILDNAALTGSLGFVINPNDNLSIRANASTGFRSPNVDDVGKVFDSTPGSVVIPNPDLKAEYAFNYELGIAKVFGDVLKIDLTGFYTTLENAMVRRNYTLNGQSQINYNGTLSQVQAIQNAAVANVIGLQAGLELKIAKGLSFSSQFNLQDGEEELDNGEKSPSRHAAPWFGVSRLTYIASGLNLQFYAQYSGEVSYEKLSEEGRATDYIYAIDKNGKPYSPSWYTFNFKALYPLSERFTLTAGVENLTDQRYRPYSSGIVAPGRNVILALSLHW